MDEFKSEKRWVLPCCKPKTINQFMYFGASIKKQVGTCDNCHIDVCRKVGKPIRAEITYSIKVVE